MMGNEQLPFGERVRLLVEESVELGMSPEGFAGLVESYRLLYLRQKHDREVMRENMWKLWMIRRYGNDG